MSRPVARGSLRSHYDRVAELPACELPVIFQDWIHLSQAATDGFRDRIFTRVRTFWLFLSQVFSADGSCQEALMKARAWIALETDEIASASTSAYCQARKRLPTNTVRRAGKTIVERLGQAAQGEGLWCGRTVKVVDGSSAAMADTPENQKTFPQPDGQKPGCGFPVVRLVCLFSLATGALLACAQGALKTSERSLWRTLWKHLDKSDIVLADRGFCSFAEFAMLLGLGVDCVMRLHSRRGAGTRVVKRLGRQDELMEWQKTSVRPRWLPDEQWRAMPATLLVRHVSLTVEIEGFRTQTIIVATTLLDPKVYPARALAQLYRRRWLAELFLRNIKCALGMEMLRCKSPEMIRKEIEMHLIAYNLIRALMGEASRSQRRDLERLSFKQSLAVIRQWAPMVAGAPDEAEQTRLMRLLLHYVAYSSVPHRPDRSEPRAVKKRSKNYQLLNKPRHEFQEIPHRNKYKKSLS